jgi:hypothetical protein
LETPVPLIAYVVGLLYSQKRTFSGATAMSVPDPGCVKTSFHSVFGANMADFQELESAKSLILLIQNFNESTVIVIRVISKRFYTAWTRSGRKMILVIWLALVLPQ